MLRIRLRRTGKKHQPHYRLVVAEHTAPLTGKFVALLGHYNPRTKELVIKDKEILEWIDKGAKPSNTVARLLTKQGLKHKQIVIHQYPERPSKKDAKEAAEASENGTTEAPAADTTPATEPNAEKSQDNPEEEKQEESAEEKPEDKSEAKNEEKQVEEKENKEDTPPQEGSKESK